MRDVVGRHAPSSPRRRRRPRGRRSRRPPRRPRGRAGPGRGARRGARPHLRRAGTIGRAMRHAWANVALLALVVVAVATGLGGLLISDRDGAIVFWLHGIAAWSIVGLLVVKGRVIVDRRSGAARRVTRLAGGVPAAAGAAPGGARDRRGLGAARRLPAARLLQPDQRPRLPGDRAGAAPGVARARRGGASSAWRGARDRAAFLRYGGAAVLGLVLWRVERLVEAAIGPEGRRRFTGSYERGSALAGLPARALAARRPRSRRPRRVAADGGRRGAQRRWPSTRRRCATLPRAPSAARSSTARAAGGASRTGSACTLRDLLRARRRDGRRRRSIRVVSTTGYDRRFALDVADGPAAGDGRRRRPADATATARRAAGGAGPPGLRVGEVGGARSRCSSRATAGSRRCRCSRVDDRPAARRPAS